MSTIDISYRRIAQIAGPVVVSNFSYTAMGLIDTMMVGRLGVVALAAVGLGNMVAFSLLSFFWGSLSGVNTLVAQAVGARDRVAVGRVFFQGLYLALAGAVLLSVSWPLLAGLIAWIGPTEGVEAIATDYMRIRLLGSWGVVLLWASDNFYRGIGRTTVTMWCGLVQLVLNCGLNYLLIFGKLGFPEMGAAGAALGTVVAQLVVGGLLFATITWFGAARREFDVWNGWRFRPALFRRLLKLSLPIGVQTCLEMGGVTVFTALVARLGDAELAATNAVIQAWSVAFMGAFALSVGATTLVGQCIGAGEDRRVRTVVRRVTRVGYLLTAAVGAVYVLFPERLMGLFVSGEELVRLAPFARPLFTVVVLCLVFDLKFNILSGVLRGAGDTTFSMLVNVGSAWLVFVPALLLVTPRFGLIGAWSCFILHVFVMALALELRVRGDRWLGRGPLHRGAGVAAAAEEDGVRSTLSASAPARGSTSQTAHR